MSQEEDIPTIPEFYKGRNVFVTGFSGFMGKALVEKLLWSCPDLENIFVLLRTRRNLNPDQRLQKIINSDLFKRLREEKSDQLKKIVILPGDVTLEGLGLSPQHRALIIEKASLIFHCAASVKFDDPLTYALDINVKGTKSAIDLALEMPKLVAFVHVSTAYSNCDKFDIEEKVYPPHADWSKTLEIRDKIDSITFNILSKKYTNLMPNTYVFAKSLGEHIVNDYSDRIPVVIFRPSIVVSTFEEPFAGWIDNMNGPTGLLGGFGTGAVRTAILDSTIQPDFMPVDLAIRGMIVCAYTRLYKRDEGIHFYNWCTKERSVTYGDIVEMGKKLLEDAPNKFVLWRPTTSTTASSLVFYINFLLFQMIPAVFVDLGLRIIGRKPMLMKLQIKIFNAMKALSYFTLNYFYFHNDNGYDLVNYIKKEDYAEFNYVKKPEEVDTYIYFYWATKYFQKRFLKMKPSDDEIAVKVRDVMKIVDYVVKTCFWLTVAYAVYSYQLVPRFIFATLNFITNF